MCEYSQCLYITLVGESVDSLCRDDTDEMLGF